MLPLLTVALPAVLDIISYNIFVKLQGRAGIVARMRITSPKESSVHQ